MNLKNVLASCLISFCLELGYVKFDEETNRRKEITASSYVVEWKVPAEQEDDAVEYLRLGFPDVEDSVIKEVIKEHLL